MNLTHKITRQFKRKSTIPWLTFKVMMKANGYTFMFNYPNEQSFESAREVVEEYGYDYVIGPAYSQANVHMDTYRSLYVKVPKALAAELKEELNYA